MEVQVSPQAQNHNLPIRKSLSGGYQKDLWLVVLEGSVADVDAALILLKKSGGNINTRNAFGLTPLHIATWRNHIPIVRKLLAAGADPDARDGESGWSSLHRALHFGHLTVASILLQSGASITLEDSKYRTPLDLLSAPLLQAVDQEHHSATEIFSWGSGANYQLGTGNAHIQKLPCKIDSLHGYLIKFISAAKFHSVAVTTDGKLFTWGFGRGGRLGHPDFDIHSGQAAVITPRQVISGLGTHRVKAIATAKHHTVIATESGEVFTWGSNREGQLGYTSVDTQPTPRRVSSLRSKIIAVAAANKHTAVVSELGEVFTWGCNREGQLGYGTSNSASNYTPHVVEYLKGKVFAGVSASKYHTLVLGADGEAYTWGHRLVSPRRVVIARNLKKSGNVPLKFHRMKRLHVVAIAAGMLHSMALIDDGALFCWVSSDPDLKCQQLYSMCGKNIVSISAGKYWTAAVTSTGDVYMWDGKKGKDKPLVANRLHGVKRATSVAVGETHLLIVNSLYHPTYPSYVPENSENLKLTADDDDEELSEDLTFSDMDSICLLPSTDQKDNPLRCSIPSLKSLCEKAAAECLVEPRNAIQMLEIADSLEADGLRKHCEDIVLRNLDYIFMVSSNAIASAAPDLLVNLEKLLDQRSSEPWSHRRIPTPTATLPAITNSEGEDIVECERTRDDNMRVSALKLKKDRKLESFLQPKNDPNQGIMREVRALRKKLQQIEMLEAKQFDGHPLDGQQILKLRSKSVIENSLAELGAPVEPSQGKGASSVPTDGKVSKKAEQSRKRRNDKTRGLQIEVTSIFSRNQGILDPVKGSRDSELLRVSETKDEDVKSERMMADQFEKKQPVLVQDKDSSALLSQPRTASKKKSKKGGLSMFLSGALDDAPKEIAPPPSPIPKIERPAWGGAKMAKGLSSLREIQDEQKKIKGNQFTKSNDHVEQHSDRNSGKVLLSSFLPSSPIPVTSTLTSVASVASDGDRGTPPWAASGTPPLLSRPSLRDIQMQQEKKQLSLSHSPKTKVAGFSITSGQGSPSESNAVNRWFKPEIDMPSSIRSIQIEEKAIKDLKRFYSTVKIVKNQ